MEHTQVPTVATPAIGTTALGRLQMRVLQDDGYEEVVVERRWPDMQSAREWCERTVARSAEGTTVLEIQVFEESWRHAKSWETIKHRPVAEALQLGVVTDDGSVHWARSRSMTPGGSSRHLF